MAERANIAAARLTLPITHNPAQITVTSAIPGTKEAAQMAVQGGKGGRGG